MRGLGEDATQGPGNTTVFGENSSGDPPAWCEATGHALLGLERRGAAWVAWVRKADGGA